MNLPKIALLLVLAGLPIAGSWLIYLLSWAPMKVDHSETMKRKEGVRMRLYMNEFKAACWDQICPRCKATGKKSQVERTKKYWAHVPLSFDSDGELANFEGREEREDWLCTNRHKFTTRTESGEYSLYRRNLLENKSKGAE